VRLTIPQEGVAEAEAIIGAYTLERGPAFIGKENEAGPHFPKDSDCL
jgi:hypothetical protein